MEKLFYSPTEFSGEDTVAFQAVAIFPGQSFIQRRFDQIVHSCFLLGVSLYQGSDYFFCASRSPVTTGYDVRFCLVFLFNMDLIHGLLPPNS